MFSKKKVCFLTANGEVCYENLMGKVSNFKLQVDNLNRQAFPAHKPATTLQTRRGVKKIKIKTHMQGSCAHMTHFKRRTINLTLIASLFQSQTAPTVPHTTKLLLHGSTLYFLGTPD